MEFNDLPRDVQKRVVRLLDIDSRRAMNVYCKLRVPAKLESLITNSWKQLNHVNYGHGQFYTLYVTPKYKIDRWIMANMEAGECYMQLVHTGFYDLHCWENL